MKNKHIIEIIEEYYDGEKNDKGEFQQIAKKITEYVYQASYKDENLMDEINAIGNEFDIRHFVEDYLIDKYSN